MAGYPGFVSVDGTAETTGLQNASVDLIVAGQAFHWFDPVRTRTEFVRIARPGAVVGAVARPSAVVALIWNERLIGSVFERGYEELILEYAGDYKTINHKNITDKQIGNFFRPQTFQLQVFENEQRFDFDGLKGRLLSSSYIPKEGPRHGEMMEALAVFFERHAAGGQVRVGYETKVYTGNLLITMRIMLVKSIGVFLLMIGGMGMPAFAQWPTGKVIEQRTVRSAILGKDVKYTIYLPADYGTSERPYPVVYLLHGYTDDNTGWLQFGEINRLAERAIGGDDPADDHCDAEWGQQFLYQFI